LENPR